MADIEIKLPQILKLDNKSDRAISFVPYRENFTTSLKAGTAIEFPVSTSGQVIYYFKQATSDFEVTQLTEFDSASDTLLLFELPSIITLHNTSSVVKTFQPYKENFTVDIEAGDSYKIEVTTVGQLLYYLAQKTDGLDVSYAKKVVNPGK